jgi:hypothetical protein
VILATVDQHTAVVLVGVFAVFFLVLGFFWALGEIGKLRTRRPAVARPRRVETGDCWDQLPPKWHPPVSRTEVRP